MSSYFHDIVYYPDKLFVLVRSSDVLFVLVRSFLCPNCGVQCHTHFLQVGTNFTSIVLIICEEVEANCLGKVLKLITWITIILYIFSSALSKIG